MRPSNIVSHFGLLALTAAFLSTPFLASRTLLSFSGEKPVESGTVLSAESSAYNRYLRYVFPGQTTSYKAVYQVKNQQSRPVAARLVDVNLKSPGLTGVQVNAYFGPDQNYSRVMLNPGESAPVNLQLSAPPSLTQPIPVEVSFSVEIE